MNKRPGDRYVYRGRNRPPRDGTSESGPAWARFPGAILDPRPDGGESTSSLIGKYLAVIGVLALTTLALWPVRETIGLLNIGLVYLIEVVAATILVGRGAGILASVVGFILFDYFLIPPYLTFAI